MYLIRGMFSSAFLPAQPQQNQQQTDWTPPPPRYTTDTFVPLRIEATDIPMRSQAKAAGGRWAPGKRLWFVKYGKIAGTPLEKHIHIDDKR
jgi:hypothetical protein